MPIHLKVGRLEHIEEVELWKQLSLCLWSWPTIYDYWAAGPENPAIAIVVRGDTKESNFLAAVAAIMGTRTGAATVLHRENQMAERLSELKDIHVQIIQVEEEREHIFL